MTRLDVTRERRATAEEFIARQDPRIHTLPQLADMLRDAGFRITNAAMLNGDIKAIGATKIKAPDGGKGYYVLAGKNLQTTLDTAVAETEARSRMAYAGVKVVSLEGCVPIFAKTLDHAGQLAGQPFGTWLPFGVEATISGPEGVLFWVRSDQAERVKMMLHKMMVGS